MKLATLTRTFKSLVIALTIATGLAAHAFAAPGNFWKATDNAHFRQNGGGQWTEHYPNGQVKFNFEEKQRTEQGVLLFDGSRNLYLFLSDNQCHIYMPDHMSQWGVLTAGGWAADAQPQPQPLPAENPNRIFIDDLEFGLNGSSQRPGLHLIVTPKVSTLRDGSRHLFVDLNGSELHANKGGQLETDSLFDRGWYLENVTTTITVLDPNVRLGSNAVFVAGNNGSVTVSQSRSFTQEIGISKDGPNAGFSTGQERSDSYTTDFKGFTAMASDTGRTAEGHSYAKNVYNLTGCMDRSNLSSMRGYSKWEDLVDAPKDNVGGFWYGFGGVFNGQAWESYRLHGLPAQAKSGFPVISQVGFLAPTGYSQPATVRVKIDFQLRRVSTSGETKFDSSYKTHGYYSLTATRDVPVHFGYPQN